MRRIISTFLSALIFIFAVNANVSDNIMLDSDSELIASSTLSSFIDNARSGNTEAQRLAGLCYLYGNGVDSDRSEAWKWIAKSASSGDHVSQYYLGVFYMSGWGVKPDSREAAYWFRKAGSNGQSDAQSRLGDMFLQGDGVLQDSRIAAEWYWRSAAQGNAAAQYKLAEMYRDGIGVDRSASQARGWFEKAAESNYRDAAIQAERLPKQANIAKKYKGRKNQSKSRRSRR